MPTAGSFHTHRGSLAHDELIGQPDGSVVHSSGGTPYVALRPLLADFTLGMGRGAAVIYPKDAAHIVAFGDIFPGARVLEAGAGSGALSCWLLRAVGDGGLVASYERRPDFAEVARRNVEKFFGGPHPAWRLTVGDLADAEPADRTGSTGSCSTCSPRGSSPPPPGGCSSPAGWSAVTSRPPRSCPGPPKRCAEQGCFDEPAAWESLVRGWHVDGLAVRPEHRMVGHTGFLVTARRLADGVTPPPRRRRPAKGAHGTDAG